MAAKFPSIPEPVPTSESLHDAVLALKHAVELLTGQIGKPDTTAATKDDIAKLLALLENSVGS